MAPIQHVNLSRPKLVDWALKLEKGTVLTDKGALAVSSFKYTGRVPKAKRVVDTDDVRADVDWGKVNIKLSEDSFMKVRERALKFLESRDHLFIVNCFAGADPRYRMKIRIITTRPYHAMFMMNMLIEPTPEELANFGKPDFVIYNAGETSADQSIPGVDSDACVALNFKRREQVILGTQYAGEMKKGVLTVMMYVLPKQGHLCMHASANEGEQGDVSVFFGLSGTGKTTLSADPKRKLIGDDEHVWTDKGVFNIEGGCYAKAVGLKLETEPDIFKAIRFGAVAENCVLKTDGSIDYDDISITENTRVSYPLSYIKGSKIPSVAGHVKNVIFLTNDAYGVLPPVSLLTHGQAMFWFITGYTAKVPGTEAGVKEPVPTFSSCFGGPFLVLHPTYYGKQLAEKLQKHNARCWLVNTGYSGGAFGKGGSRMKLKITRALIDGIHDGTLEKQDYETVPGWGLRIPKRCPNVPSEVLNPIKTWKNKEEFVKTIDKVALMFKNNFQKFASQATPEMLAAVPGPYRASTSKL